MQVHRLYLFLALREIVTQIHFYFAKIFLLTLRESFQDETTGL